jgi:hypothetical protein
MDNLNIHWNNIETAPNMQATKTMLTLAVLIEVLPLLRLPATR